MDVPTVVANALTFTTNTFVRPALQGLSDADLLKRPNDACNPIGWLLWHQTRVEDAILSGISGSLQTWVADIWHAQFGRPADPHDTGFGHSLEQVMALQPTITALQGYAAAVRDKTLTVLPPPNASRPGARTPLPARWHQNSRGLAGHFTD
jgi:hypothetical protein